jgi:hypothetical protein
LFCKYLQVKLLKRCAASFYIAAHALLNEMPRRQGNAESVVSLEKIKLGENQHEPH